MQITFCYNNFVYKLKNNLFVIHKFALNWKPFINYCNCLILLQILLLLIVNNAINTSVFLSIVTVTKVVKRWHKRKNCLVQTYGWFSFASVVRSHSHTATEWMKCECVANTLQIIISLLYLIDPTECLVWASWVFERSINAGWYLHFGLSQLLSSKVSNQTHPCTGILDKL